MDKDSVLAQLTDLRLDGVQDQIACVDEEYLSLSRESKCYLEKLERLELSDEARKLMDRHASAQNAMGGRYGELAYRLGFADCMELVLSALRPHS